MKAVLTLAAAYALVLAFALALGRAMARGDRMAQAPDWWAELDAEPQTGVCATCRQPVTRSMAWCDRVCQRAFMEDA